MYSEDDLEDLRKAGRVAEAILTKIGTMIVPGRKIADLADIIEKTIRSSDSMMPAFPSCISVNDMAAHDSAAIIERRLVPENGVVKVDLGVSVNGNIVDTARTFGVGEFSYGLIESSEAALIAAIEIIRDGVKISEVGKVIQNVIESFKLTPVRNLTGHSIERGILHAGISIPNVASSMGIFGERKLKSGMLIAVEPFATEGNDGYVIDAPGREPLIFSAKQRPKTPLGKALWREYRQLPFSTRNAARFLNIPLEERYNAIDRAASLEHWNRYPPLL
ncbi:MAG TPA: M24 family metallopeptidase, partial [Candidatus Hodarchaeales archaeon]|nr:M24 family metallopeptidase [Candidatus Hodarchaeales archaeon]